ncbi:MAG: RidA family protein [Planctomycetota bacterium]
MEYVQTDRAPAAIGPYAQAVVHGDLVFCSGQIALDPETQEMVGETAPEQARQVLQNLAAVLEAAGSSLQSVLKTTIYLTDVGDFPAVNEVYSETFRDHRPARATVEVSGLPKDARVEIEAVARREA